MPAVDLSQLPEPAIIAEPDFEAILADTKAMMIAAYPPNSLKPSPPRWNWNQNH